MADIPKKGDCYVAAGSLALEFIRGKKPKAELVHGVVLNSLDYEPMGHAWVEVGSKVYDYSNGKKLKMSKQGYYFQGVIKELMKKGYKQHRYKGMEVAEAVVKHGTWGPWENQGVRR